MSFLSDFSLQSSEFSGQHGLEDTLPVEVCGPLRYVVVSPSPIPVTMLSGSGDVSERDTPDTAALPGRWRMRADQS